MQKGCFSPKSKNRIANSVDPDETAHLHLHCLHSYLFWSAGLKRLREQETILNPEETILRSHDVILS